MSVTRSALATLAAVSALGLAAQAHAAPIETVFAQFSASNNKTNITWSNNTVAAVYKTIPAVTQTTPAVYKTVPAVTKIVNGKTVIVTPAKQVLVTPAKTVVITPAKTVLVSPAHDGTSGSLFSTTTTKPGAFGAAQVNFDFLGLPLSKLGFLPALFTFQAASPAVDPAQTLGGLLTETDLSGQFSFIYDGIKPLKVWATTYQPGSVLLAGDLKNFIFDGAGGSGAIIAPGIGPSAVNFSSDFLDFSHTTARELSWYFLSNTKFKADPGAALHTVSGNSGGNFASAGRPRLTAVPEASTWALMILGFGGVGAALRSRKRALIAI